MKWIQIGASTDCPICFLNLEIFVRIYNLLVNKRINIFFKFIQIYIEINVRNNSRFMMIYHVSSWDFLLNFNIPVAIPLHFFVQGRTVFAKLCERNRD